MRARTKVRAFFSHIARLRGDKNRRPGFDNWRSQLDRLGAKRAGCPQGARWLFNHIRNEDTGYVDSAKAYLRMARESSPAAEKERLKNEVLQELELQRKKKGWLARLLNR
jgi:hypothetical protein